MTEWNKIHVNDDGQLYVIVEPPAEMVTITIRQISHRCRCHLLPEPTDHHGYQGDPELEQQCPNDASYWWKWDDSPIEIPICTEHAAVRRELFAGEMFGHYSIRSI